MNSRTSSSLRAFLRRKCTCTSPHCSETSVRSFRCMIGGQIKCHAASMTKTRNQEHASGLCSHTVQTPLTLLHGQPVSLARCMPALALLQQPANMLLADTLSMHDLLSIGPFMICYQPVQRGSPLPCLQRGSCRQPNPNAGHPPRP